MKRNDLWREKYGTKRNLKQRGETTKSKKGKIKIVLPWAEYM